MRRFDWRRFVDHAGVAADAVGGRGGSAEKLADEADAVTVDGEGTVEAVMHHDPSLA